MDKPIKKKQRGMKIIILPVGRIMCPSCHEETDWFVDYYRDDDGVKLPNGVECGECGHNLTDKEFRHLKGGGKTARS